MPVCVPAEDLLGIHGDGKHSYRTGQNNCVYVSPLKNLLGIHRDGESEQDKMSVCVSASISVEEPHGNTWRRGNTERNLVPPLPSDPVGHFEGVKLQFYTTLSSDKQT